MRREQIQSWTDRGRLPRKNCLGLGEKEEAEEEKEEEEEEEKEEENTCINVVT